MAKEPYIYLYPQSKSPEKGGFKNENAFRVFFEKELPEDGRYRYTDNKHAKTIVLLYGEEIRGHLEIANWEPFTEEDKYKFPEAARKKKATAYLVNRVVLYRKPIPLLSLLTMMGRKRAGQRGFTIPKDVFETILGDAEPYYSPPAQPLPNARDSDEELAENLIWIRERLRQTDFRKTLDVAYEGRCAVTGYAVADALEAAHIKPFSQGGQAIPSNGLLLRCDIHALFDANRLAIEPNTMRVTLARALQQTPYTEYDGRELRRPTRRADEPNTEALKMRWEEFRDAR